MGVIQSAKKFEEEAAPTQARSHLAIPNLAQLERPQQSSIGAGMASTAIEDAGPAVHSRKILPLRGILFTNAASAPT
jgi:hypothetical protein